MDRIVETSNLDGVLGVPGVPAGELVGVPVVPGVPGAMEPGPKEPELWMRDVRGT
jgi:hypothetical protein